MREGREEEGKENRRRNRKRPLIVIAIYTVLKNMMISVISSFHPVEDPSSSSWVVVEFLF